MNPIVRWIGAWFLFLAVMAPADAANWAQFRGPTGLGFTEERNLPLTWGGRSNENVLWASPLKGQGHASHQD